MVSKLKSIFSAHKYAISILLFMFIYSFVVVNRFSFCQINDITYTYHLVDYSLGLCTKLLPGAIYNVIFPTTSAFVVNIYFTVLYAGFWIVVAFLLEKFIVKFETQDKAATFLVVLLFITGPATFSLHTNGFGMLDTYWIFISVAFLIFIQNRWLKWFVPVFFVLAILIHVSAMVSFVPFFALLVLFQASKNQKGKIGYLLILFISVALSVLTFLYFLFNEESNLTVNLEEFHAFISNRNKSEWLDYTKYYDYSLFKVPYLEEYLNNKTIKKLLVNDSGVLANIINDVWSQFNITFTAYAYLEGYFYTFINNVIITSPIIFLIYKYIFHNFKNTKNNIIRSFAWFCSLFLFPLTFLSGAICSPDINRWFGNGFFMIFTLVIYEIYKSDNNAIKSLNKYTQGVPLFISILHFIFYSTCIVDPYC